MKKRLITAAALALALPLSLAAASPSMAAPALAAKTVTVKGHIKSPTGKAIPAVTVSVYSSVNGHSVVVRAKTSRTGRYEIKIAKSAFSYQLKVYDYGDADADNGDGEWAATLKRFDFEGSSFKVDQVLHHGARVSGRVYDRNGKPVGAGVKVGAGLLGLHPSTPGAGTLTRADGTYRITNAPAGSGIVAFVSPRIDESSRWYSSSSIYGTQDESKVTLLKFANGKTISGINFQFPYLGKITGAVYLDGETPGEEGSPVEGVLLDSKGTEIGSFIGNYEFALYNLVPGTYYLKFRADPAEPDAVVTEYYKDSATLGGATPLVIDAKGSSITGLTVNLSSR